MNTDQPVVFLCCHCGNRTPHTLRFSYTAEHLYEEVDRRYYEPFTYYAFLCGTCTGLTLLGRFDHETSEHDPDYDGPPRPQLYPNGPEIEPARHTVPGGNPVPLPVRKAFQEAWPLRHTAPGAFANQIRRTLEFICRDQEAVGQNLHMQLQDLAKRGVFPPDLADIADLVRELGNIGSHASTQEISIWDGELLDELFRMILEYVYVGPARVQRLKQRMGHE
ncbi:DUF4145 domain-containing protein [Aquisalimonas lutea]|uniref:DUF4145 domain-containing protein n=1 Tax=Aquisalimonas lutea TaxID=1327750 RepID=UPI0025B5FFC6|nr:DUF4145 domain-containing protein [Aquisalimonas lutea]MDN3517496.1 DUF4145 domain-containing protein [Aquisalimonas lutea]